MEVVELLPRTGDAADVSRVVELSLGAIIKLYEILDDTFLARYQLLDPLRRKRL